MSALGTEWKTTKRATIHGVTPRQLEWAAGFLEGEGSFCRSGDDVMVVAKQVNKEPMNKLLALFGGSVGRYRPDNDARPFRSRPLWRWGAYGARARGIMMSLYSLLSARRKQQIRRALKEGR